MKRILWLCMSFLFKKPPVASGAIFPIIAGRGNRLVDPGNLFPPLIDHSGKNPQKIHPSQLRFFAQAPESFFANYLADDLDEPALFV